MLEKIIGDRKMKLDFLQEVLNKNEQIIKQFVTNNNFSENQVCEYILDIFLGLERGDGSLLLKNEKGSSVKEIYELPHVKLGYYVVAGTLDSKDTVYQCSLHTTGKYCLEYSDFIRKKNK